MATIYIKLGPNGDSFNSEELGIFLDKGNAAEVSEDLIRSRLGIFFRTEFLVQITKIEYENIKLNSLNARNIPLINVNLSQSNTYEPVESFSSIPPDTLLNDRRYIIGTNATGVWAGHDGKIAFFDGNQWVYKLPENGMSIPVYSLGISAIYSGAYPLGSWSLSGAPEGSFNDSSYLYLLELIGNLGNSLQVPSWVREITQEQIAAWDEGTGGLGGGTVDLTGLENVELLAAFSYVNGYLLVNKQNLRVGYADDSGKWGGRSFRDYMDQPVKKDSAVRHKSVESEGFISGFTGSGWRIDEYGNAFFNNLDVRKEFNVYELVVNKISGSNGAIAVTDSATIESVADTDDGLSYAFRIDTAEETIQIPFRVGDILRCQIWTGSSIKYYTLIVNSYDTGRFTCLKSSKTGGGIPAKGDSVHRFGNVSDTDRQGLLYLTSSDSHSPYMDVLDGITSDDFTGKTRVRLGKLDGITDPNYGPLSGYGLYTDNGYFRGRITVIGSGSNVPTTDEFLELSDSLDTQLQLIRDITDDLIEAVGETTEYVDAIIGNRLEALQQQIDGKIETYFYNYDPLASNLPAASWTTDADRTQHVNDIFYNNVTGKAFRYAKIGANYSWEPIIDIDILEALDNASKAQDTADGKRRIFLTQPAPPYDRGDIWAQGPQGEILRCLTTRLEGIYTPADWGPSAKYTDDTKALQVETAFNTLTGQLKGLAYQDLVQLALLGDTIIQGGLIRTVLLDAAAIRANIINAGYINTLELNAGTITSGVFNTDRLNVTEILVRGNAATQSYVNNTTQGILAAAQAYTDEMLEGISGDIGDASGLVNTLRNYVNGAFQDGIIEKAEAISIEKYLNTLTTENRDITARYNLIYNVPELAGVSERANLLLRMNQYNDSSAALINGINSAIADGRTTVAEGTNVDNLFNSYKIALENLSYALEASVTAIQTVKSNNVLSGANAAAIAQDDLKLQLSKAYADGKVTAEEEARVAQALANLNAAKADATAKINGIKLGGRNLIKNGNWMFGQENLGSNGGTQTIVSREGQNWLRVGTTSYGQGFYFNNNTRPYRQGQEYTISFDIKGLFYSHLNLLCGFNSSGQIIQLINTDQTRRYSITRMIGADAGPNDPLIFYNGANGPFDFDISNIKVEEGNKDTGFSTSPEDDIRFSNQASDAARIAATNYAAAQAAYEREVAKAYADGIVDVEEAARIEQALNNLNIAKADATAKADAARAAGINASDGRNYASGKMLYRDPTFLNGGLNGIGPYNNNPGGGTITLDRINRASLGIMPTDWGMRVRYRGNAEPGLGGFSFFTQSRPNAKFVTRIIALIQPGYTINWASNPVGDGAKSSFSTSQQGTGKFEEYIHVLQCGQSGNFSSTSFFYLEGPQNEGEWYVSYATVFDLTDSEMDYEKDATAKANAAREAAINAAASSLGTLTNALRSLAYQDLKDVAIGGQTLITGGMINTFLIDAQAIVTKVLTADFIQTQIIKAEYINVLSLVSRSVKTSETGTRWEILQSDNSMRFYDANNRNVIALDATGSFQGGILTYPGLRVGVKNERQTSVDENGLWTTDLARSSFIRPHGIQSGGYVDVATELSVGSNARFNAEIYYRGNQGRTVYEQVTSGSNLYRKYVCGGYIGQGVGSNW
jgi:hypothetical protein